MGELFYQTERPKILDGIIGHDKTINEIKNRFISGDFPQVVYITGVTGCGKTTLARNIAKVLQCKSKINAYTPCNNCMYCNNINKELWISGTVEKDASDLDLNSVKQLGEESTSMDFLSDVKVIIIDELQQLNNNEKAKNTFLKILEKINPKTYFILLSMDDSKIGKALKSRCVTYKLNPVPYENISEVLINICQNRNIELTEEKINILISIAENSEGSVRDSISKLEKVIYGNLWTEVDLKEVLQITTTKEINHLILKLIDFNEEIFSYEINEFILTRIRWKLVQLLKHLLDVKLNDFEKRELYDLIGYKFINFENIRALLDTTQKILSFPYINKEIIDTILIDWFSKKQKFQIRKEEAGATQINQPLRRKRQ